MSRRERWSVEVSLSFSLHRRYLLISVRLYIVRSGEIMRAPLSPELLQELRDRIRGIEGIKDRGLPVTGLSTGFASLDRVLASRGLRTGSLVEWRSAANGSGATTLALAVAGH